MYSLQLRNFRPHQTENSTKVFNKHVDNLKVCIIHLSRRHPATEMGLV